MDVILWAEKISEKFFIFFVKKNLL